MVLLTPCFLYWANTNRLSEHNIKQFLTLIISFMTLGLFWEKRTAKAVCIYVLLNLLSIYTCCWTSSAYIRAVEPPQHIYVLLNLLSIYTCCWTSSAFSTIQPCTTQSRLSTTLTEKAFENIVGKGENADNQHFHLFTFSHDVFYLSENKFQIFVHIYNYFVVCKCFQFGLV